MAKEYWNNEEPVTLETRANVLKLFIQAGKLQVSRPNWTDGNGESKQGKTVTLDLNAQGVKEFLRRAIEGE